MPLQQFKGHYVDYRLKQFRTVTTAFEPIEFIEFHSDKGDALLVDLIESGQADWSKLHL